MVIEFRQYTLHPGRRDELIELFERAFIDPQEALGIRLLGLFRDDDRPDRFVWIRSFADMASRAPALAAFYGGEVWKRHRDAANATMIDSDNVLLVRPADANAAFQRSALRGPLVAATYAFEELEQAERHAARFSNDDRVIASLVTETSPNDFPQLPVRENERVALILSDGYSVDDLTRAAEGHVEFARLSPTTRSRVQ